MTHQIFWHHQCSKGFTWRCKRTRRTSSSRIFRLRRPPGLLTCRSPPCGQSPRCLFEICAGHELNQQQVVWRGGFYLGFFRCSPPFRPNHTHQTPRNSNNPEMMESVSSGNQTRIHFQQRASAFPDPPRFHIVAIKRRNYYLGPFFFFFLKDQRSKVRE